MTVTAFMTIRICKIRGYVFIKQFVYLRNKQFTRILLNITDIKHVLLEINQRVLLEALGMKIHPN